jgi:glyoxylase-like metal-dependent hydrolase (beta-lactamase superfamily II)
MVRVIPLHRESDTDYSCTSYWVLGDANESWDKNTLIDTGSPSAANLGYYMREMNARSKGIGKMAIEQVILTHGHYDHSGGLPGIVKQFAPPVYSWLEVPGRHQRVSDGERLTVGDQEATLLHTPGHSDDSICVYVPASGALFSGDTIFKITDDQGRYSRAYAESLARIADLDVRTIYPGHGQPIVQDARAFIAACLGHVLRSTGADGRG